MDDYLAKPVRVAELQEKMLKWLPRSKIASEAEPLAGESSAAQAPQPPPTGAVIDIPTIEELHDLLQDKYGQTLQRYLEDSKTRVEALIAAWEKEDLATMAAQAHPLKSASQYVGALGLKDLMQDIEQAAKHGQKEALVLSVERLKILYPAVTAALTKILMSGR